MEYREIVSVTGLGGLYQLVTTKGDGAVVRNIADGATKFISARIHNVTPLESIEIYTKGNNVRLHEVLLKMKESKLSLPDVKASDNETIRAYFRDVFPDMDEDRVYVSDMKKMLKWFVLLQDKDLLNFELPAHEETAEAPVAEEVVAEAPAKKTTRKKKAAADNEKSEETTKAAPKKTTRKKKDKPEE